MGDSDSEENAQKTVNLTLRKQNKDNGKICYTDCIHAGNPKYRGPGTQSCCICNHTFHSDCAESIDSTKTVWTCHSCRTMPDTVSQLSQKLDQVLQQNDWLIDMITKQQTVIDLIQAAQSQFKTQIENHDDDIKEAVSRTNAPIVESDDEDDEIVECMGTLLVGDSMVRNIQSTCEDLQVECQGGAKINDVKNWLKTINPKKRKYKDIICVCGTNDAVTKKTAEKIARDYDRLLLVAKERAENVHVSSIMPRADDKADLQRIENINMLLTTTATATGVTYINNDKNFKYRDDTVDLSLLSSTDKVHLSSLGVTKLLQNLNLQDKARSSFGQGPINRWSHEKTVTTKPNDVPRSPPVIDLATPRSTDESPSPITVKFRGPNDPFSNFYHSNIEIWNLRFKTNEHAYQYRKAIEMGQHVTAEEIRRANSPRQAQLIADKIKTDERWCNMKQSVMYFLLQEKARQCYAFQEKILASQGNKLIEDTGHEFWGRGRSGDGLNMLGRLIETLRENMPVSQNVRVQQSQRRQQHHEYTPTTRRHGQQAKCYNCGEKSHNRNTCRHQSPLQCYSCQGYGHKQKFCWQSTSKTQ